MKTLYESILDSDLETKMDTKLDMFGTTKKAFERRTLDPFDFFEMRHKILDEEPLDDMMKMHSITEEEIYAISNFIKHMHKKYGQQDIYSSAWSLSESTWGCYEIHKGMTVRDKKYLTDELNLYITTIPSKFDQWISGIHMNNEESWMMATLKKMTKEEKETWLEIMKAIEKYFN